MPINKYSTPKEVREHYPAVNGRVAIIRHILEYYPENELSELTLHELDRRLNCLTTQSMDN